MVGDVYRRIRVHLPVHLAAIASIDSYSNSLGVDCTDRRVCSLGPELSDALRTAPKSGLYW